MNDETLFDLVDENVPNAERNMLLTALLKADLKFTDPAFPLQVPKLSAVWAVDWRLAAGQKTWPEVRGYLYKSRVPNRIRHYALVVIAEHILERHKHQIQHWRNNEDSELSASKPFPNNAMNDYIAILHNCTESNLEIDSSWYLLPEVGMIMPKGEEATSIPPSMR
jgi:hypothetical protein